HTVHVTFRALWYTITATSGPDGSVSPATATVDHGDDQSFTASPNTGYTVETWYVDGQSVQDGGPTYMLVDISDDHTVHVTFRQMLSYSLGDIDFEDPDEFDRLVITNNPDEPDEALVVVEPVGFGLDPDNLAMGLRNRKDRDGKTINARAKAMFVRTGADEILIYFKYLFMTSSVELVVYISDSPLLLAPDDPLRDQHDVEVARLVPPPFPRPGAPGTGRFGVFQKIIWTGHLNFTENVHVELELVELDNSGSFLAHYMPKEPTGSDGSSAYVDDWSPAVQCYGICLDINWDNFVDEADFLTVIGECGSTATGEQACMDGAFSSDGYVDSYDVASWDWAMNSDERLLNFCGVSLTGGVDGVNMISAAEGSGAPVPLVELPGNLSDLLIAGKRGPEDAPSKLKDRLYVFDSHGLCGGWFEPALDRGNIRLLQGPDGELYQLNSETGLLRLDSTDEVIIPPGEITLTDINEPRYNKSATVYVGIQDKGPDSFGRPILDAAFDVNHVYVVPVVISPDGGESYTAAAKLKLLGEGDPPYEIVKLYDDPPLENDNQYRDSLREIELDSAGNVYVLNVHYINESDILWRYDPNGTIERLDLGRPDSDSYLPAPAGMYASKTTDMLYLTSAVYNPVDCNSTVIYGFSTEGALTLERSVTINDMHHATSITEDPQTGTLWVVGFNMYDVPQYPNPTQAAFYHPFLARIPYDSNSVQPTPLFDYDRHDLALPLSIVWTRAGVE
ncbi:MAG: hypothetical protein JSV03_10715, partial [Planctomycetota bacterium]